MYSFFALNLSSKFLPSAIAAALFFVFSALPVALYAQETEQDDTGRAIALFNQGQEAHEKGELKAALELYEKAINLIPEFPEAEYQRANALLGLGRQSEAERSFRRAVELREDWTLALAGLGSVLVAQGKYKEAEPILSKALGLEPQNFPAFTAIVELKLGSNAGADELSKLLETATAMTSKANPPASVWLARGALERSLGRPGDASASIAKSLQLEPGDRSALREAALAALAINDPTRASEFVSRLESRDAGSPNTILLRARVLIAQGKLDEARVSLSRIEATSPAAKELLGRLNIEMAADPAELEKRAAAEPASVALLSRLCELFRRSDPAKALEYCRQASEAEPANIDHAIGFGAALVQAKRYEESVVFFRKLASIAPTNSTIRANLATALFQLKRYPEAKAEYRWLVDNQPNLHAGYYFLAIAHDHLGEYADAMANYQEFLKRADPEKEKDEIERTNLRLPSLQRQIAAGKGSKRN